MDDLISRQQAIDDIQKGCDASVTPDTWNAGADYAIGVDYAIDRLRKLPSVQPERKQGKWMSQKEGGLCCSECGGYALDVSDGNFIRIAVPSNFCPHCGAKMKGERQK